MQGLFSFVGSETKGMHQAAYLLAAFALLSQILALLRDRLLAGAFGAGPTLDLYYAGFRLPDFLFATVASLLSLYALMPVLSRLQLEHPDLVISFMRRVLLVFFAAMALVSAVAALFAPELIAVIAPGVAQSGDGPLVALTCILLLQPILLGASNILANLTQMRHRFVLYSISPLLYNLGIIIGILFLYPRLGLAGLAWGVVLGAFLHVLVQAPFFVSERVGETLPWKRFFPMLWEVLTLSIPRTLSLAAGQISLIAIVAIASLLAAGSISVFMFAYNLQAVPLTIIGVSYSVAAFPTLSRLFAGGEKETFVRYVETALRHIVFWSLPAMVFVIVLRAQLVRAILGAGAFDWAATRLTAAALALFVLSLLAQSGSMLIARSYYAAGDTVRPFLYGCVNVIVSILSAFALVALYQSHLGTRSFVGSILRVEDVPGTEVLMLALAFALGSLISFAVSFVFFSRDFSIPLRGLGKLAFQSFAASVVGGLAAYLVLQVFGSPVNTATFVGILTQGVLAGVAGLAATGAVLWLLGNRELGETSAALSRRLARRSKVTLEPTDIAS